MLQRLKDRLSSGLRHRWQGAVAPVVEVIKPDLLKDSGISAEEALRLSTDMDGVLFGEQMYYQCRAEADPGFPVAPHVAELREILKKVMPGADIYGSALWAAAVREAHPGMEIAENDIDIGMVKDDFYGYGGKDCLSVGKKISIIQQRLPQIQWDENYAGGTVGSDYDNIFGHFVGHWTDSTGKPHRLQFNLADVSRPDHVNHFAKGDSVLTSVAMRIGDGKVRRHPDQKDHAGRLIFAATNVAGKRAEERYKALKEKIPALENVGSYRQMPKVKAHLEALQHQIDFFYEIQGKLRDGRKLEGPEVAALVACREAPVKPPAVTFEDRYALFQIK